MGDHGDLTKQNGKDDQNYNESEAEPELAAGKHDQLQTPMPVFNLMFGLFLTFLFCYINLVHLIAMAILVFSALVLKVEYKEQHNAGHHGQHTPEISNEDQENKSQHKVEDDDDDDEQAGDHCDKVPNETIQASTPTSQRNEHKKKEKKNNRNKKKVDGIVEGNLEGVLDTSDAVIELQVACHMDEEVSNETIQANQRNDHKKKENKKKKKKKNRNNKKVDGIREGILEGVRDATSEVINLATGGIFFSMFEHIFWR